MILTFSFKIQFVHAYLDRDWDPKTKLLYMFLVRLCIADYVFRVQKLQKVSSRAIFLLRIGHCEVKNRKFLW